ncbi:MAG: pentapeptide repeat-containing protein, partial [Planctomycetales bacterium]|nr:pentapeptide repeat-containing protein [Planctomycetales bacterium]
NASLAKSNLTRASLGSADLSNTDASGANFTQARMANANLINTNLRSANLTNANLDSTKMLGADLAGALITGAIFTISDISLAQLQSTASYQAGNLRGISLDGIKMIGWDFHGQDLTSANLVGSPLTDADFRGANLSNVRLESVNLVDAETIYNQWTVFRSISPADQARMTYHESPLGDMDANDVLDIADVDLLMKVIRLQADSLLGWLFPMFNVSNDADVDTADLGMWVHDLKHTWFGDANLDGGFNSSDLVIIFQAGEYEDEVENNSTWATGDWNADGDFTTSDLVVAFQDGGYEQGPRAALSAVPEPNGLLSLLIGLMGLLLRARPGPRAARTSLCTNL